MPKKNSGPSIFAILAVGVLSAISAAYTWAQQNIGLVSIAAAGVILCVALLFRAKRKKQASWIRHLNDKYGNQEVVNGILNGEFWKGQTEEQLKDSLGSPSAVDRQVLKTKQKEIWKYQEIRKGQFSLRITVENNKVIGWEQKSN